MSNLKLKTLAAATALALSGTAGAATLAQDSLFFSAFNGNPDAPSSIVINLGETSTVFKANDLATRVLATIDSAANAELTSWLNAQSANLATVNWNVFARSSGAAPSANFGGLTTMVPGSNPCLTAPGTSCGNNTGTTRINTTNGNVALFQNAMNVVDNDAVLGADLSADNATFANNGNQFFFAQQNSGVTYSTLGLLGQTLPFFSFFPQQGVSSAISNARGSVAQLGAGTGAWTFTFTPGQAANLSYSAVPVPAAVWLFGSAIAGIAGIGRRQRA